MIHENNDNKKVLPVFSPRFHFRFHSQNLNTNKNFNKCCWACPGLKNWKQYICLHSFTGVVEPAFWRHTSVYVLEDNRTKGLLTQLSDVTPLCVRTIQCLHRFLKTIDPLFEKKESLVLENNRYFLCGCTVDFLLLPIFLKVQSKQVHRSTQTTNPNIIPTNF